MTMRNDETVFGAIAEIGIKFQGPIGDLAKLLEKAFLISIAVESSEWPPHNLVGTAEAIGMTLWLEQRTLLSEEAHLELNLVRVHAGPPFSGGGRWRRVERLRRLGVRNIGGSRLALGALRLSGLSVRVASRSRCANSAARAACASPVSISGGASWPGAGALAGGLRARYGETRAGKGPGACAHRT
jgi:hypothetical protein